MFNGMRRTGRRRFIETYEFSPALHRKLRDELGDARQADIALEGLRAWYLACLYADGDLIGMPSKAVDEAWHEMILMTREYTEFCRRAFGATCTTCRTRRCDVPMHQLHEHTLRIVDDHELPLTLFTADTDAGLRTATRGVVRPAADARRERRLAVDEAAPARRGRRDADSRRPGRLVGRRVLRRRRRRLGRRWRSGGGGCGGGGCGGGG